MTGELKDRRRRHAFSLIVAAAILSALAFVVVSIDSRASKPDLMHGLVLPGLPQQLLSAQRILVTAPEGSYRIEKTAHGWVMRDRGDFPIKLAMLQRLTSGLERLEFTRRMTSDPQRLARLGVGDPRQGGQGVLLQIENAGDALLVNLILGVQPAGLYLRRPDQPQVWAANGDLPPLHDPAQWLDLKPLTLDPAQLTRVEIVPSEGRPYTLDRETAGFVITLPARLAPLSADAVTHTAELATHLAPIDVQTAPAIQGAPRAHVRLRTFDGLRIDGDLIQSDGKTWLKLIAAADNPTQEAAAQTINSQTAGWAYALSEDEAAALVPPLASLLPHPAPSAAPQAAQTAAPPRTPPAAAPPPTAATPAN